MAESPPRSPNTVCSVCTARIYRRPAEMAASRVFCSSVCYGRANRKEHPCIVCGTLILARENKKTCSRACSNSNRGGTSYGTGRLKDKVTTLRSIKLRLISERGAKCERCGYSRPEILHVHHKDRNPQNNEFRNVEIICPNCHYEEHYLEKSWMRGTLA